MTEKKTWEPFWVGIPAINTERWVAWVWWNWPELLVGLPASFAAFSVYAPPEGEPWPEPVVGVSLAAFVVLLVLAMWLIELRKWRTARRRRKMGWRWESNKPTAAASIRKVQVHQGTVTGRVNLRDADWNEMTTAFDLEGGKALRGLKLDRAWGYPNLATWHLPANNAAKFRDIELHYVPLGDPWSLPAWKQPAHGAKVFVGHTTKGDLWIDLDEIPHVAVRGGTGSGKGFFIRLLTCQALRAGWLVLLLDGGMSAEHAPGDVSPAYWRPMKVGMSEAERLIAGIEALGVVIGIVQMRAQIGERLAASGDAPDSRWPSFPDEIKLWQPRIGVVVDESTALLADSGEAEVDRLRKILRARLGSGVLRTGRKVGVHTLPLSDQTSTYSSALARGDTVQAEQIIILGNLDRGNVQAATDLKSLPRISGDMEKLSGFHLRRGNPNSVVEIRVPPNKESDLRDAALYTTGRDV